MSILEQKPHENTFRLKRHIYMLMFLADNYIMELFRDCDDDNLNAMRQSYEYDQAKKYLAVLAEANRLETIKMFGEPNDILIVNKNFNQFVADHTNRDFLEIMDNEYKNHMTFCGDYKNWLIQKRKEKQDKIKSVMGELNGKI